LKKQCKAVFIYHYNKMVHRLGATVRLIWMIGVYFWSSRTLPAGDVFFLLLLNGCLLWPGYNMVYNAVHGRPWWYLGTRESNTSSSFDLMLGLLNYPLQLILILLTAFWYPLYHRMHAGNYDGIITIMLIAYAVYMVTRFYFKRE